MSLPAVIAAPVLLAGIWLCTCAVGWARARRRTIAHANGQPAGDALGAAEVSGRIVGTAEARTPFSGRACAWWQVEVQTGTRDAFGQWHWTTRYTEASSAPFLVMDDSGYVTVHADGAQVTAGGLVIEPPPGRDVPRPCQRFMEQRNLGMRHVWGMGPMRFVERSLSEGTDVWVYGQLAQRAVSGVETVSDEATGTDALPFRTAATTPTARGLMRRGVEGEPLRIGAHSVAALTGRDAFWMTMGLLVGPVMIGIASWSLVLAVRTGTWWTR